MVQELFLEMNIFLPQNCQTMGELMDLASVPYMVLAPRDGKPIVEVVQDTMLGAFRLTQDWVRIHDKTMANLQMVNSYFKGALPGPEEENTLYYTGRQAYSQILPPGLFIELRNKAGKKFKIVDSQITEGFIDKPIYHSISKGLLPVLYHDYSPFEVRRFLDNTQRLIMRWLASAGFSVGISDLVVDADTTDRLKEAISNYKAKAYTKINDVRKGKLENNSILNNEDFFEREILNVLNDLTKVVGEIGMKKIDPKTNRMINMVKSGSKGKETNVAQMVACVGQQNVDGKRVAYGFTDRTLPHYTKYDDGPEARGFVENSFISGLSPQEVFFHAMGGREGLIDTAVKSVTGDTALVIIEDGKPKYVQIGEWIDNYLSKFRHDITYQTENDLELLYIDTKVPNKVYIPTTNADGHVSWEEVTAVTRHDPGEFLYEVKTQGGRKVTVVESKSLLIWNASSKKFEEKLTSEVTTEDFMPVTMNLVQPPETIKYIDMESYFPKDRYVHGTEFNQALAQMNNAMDGRKQIPRGWWEQNNKHTFTLPYTKKASLQRASIRSNTVNIKDGYIYPYHATRESGWIPDKFEMSYDNGVFIGLYLAEGNADLRAGRVQITNNDENVQAFVKSWFAKHNIAFEYKTRVNALGGTSSHIGGFSILLAQFMSALVGCGSHNKYVPDVAFVAPEEFVIGVLNGYFTGDGTVGDNYIESSSASARLTEGISMLCNRLGAFGKVFTTQTLKNNVNTKNIAPSHRISFRGQWAKVLQDKLTMLVDSKNDKLKAMKCSDVHRNFEFQNDVVLDKIVEIIKKPSIPGMKVYDLTVPSTLNFGLANGLHVYDTSETGYIQRRLVKAMEDCKIYYDQTVRNATGAIVQFLYGEDGMDGTKIEKQSIPTIDMNQIQLDAMYHLRPEDNLSLYLTPEALREMEADGTWVQRATQHFEDIMEDRRFLIEKVFHGQKNDKIQYPIPFERIIHTARHRLESVGVKAVPSDLTPKYILDKIDDLKQRLKIMRPNQGIRFLHILLHIYLSPKPILTQHNLSRATFDWITSEIERYFIASVGHPGEMVGIVAAQSFGELSTQQSCTKDTQIRVMGHDKAYSGSIGQFIDGLMKTNASKVVDLGNDSSAMDLEEDYYILSVSANEKTEWQRIKQISRHPAKGGLVRVHTRSGRTTTATLSHSFLQRTPYGIVPVLGSELKQGDRIPVARSIPEVSNPTTSVTLGKMRPTTFALDREFGWILGAYLADGSLGHGSVCITKLEPIFEENIRAFGARYNISVSTKTEERPNPWPTPNGKKMWTTKSTMLFHEPLQKWIDENFGRGSYQKRVPAWVYGASREFIAGMVAGFYDGDGNVNVPKCMIRAHTVNEGLADDMILLLAHCNIFAKKLVERRKREKANKFYVIHAQHKYAEQFANMIQLTVPHKKQGVLEIARFNANKHHACDMIDMIPQVDELLDQVSKKLNMPGQSRNYGKYKRLGMNRISRVALEKYYHLFLATFQEQQQNKVLQGKDVHEVERDMRLLQQAVYGDVVWDEITQVEHLPDPEEYVYDFTIPGNESFMVDAGVLVHNTLDSFHSSGTAAAVKATSGVPRLKELLSVSKNIKTPTLLIYMKSDIATVVDPVEDEEGNVSDARVQEAKERSMNIMKQLETTRLLDILESTEIYWDHPGEDGLNTGLDEDEGMIAVYRAFNQVHRCGSSSPWVLRMKLNKEKMYRLGLSMMDIYIRIHNAYKQHVECLFSDDNAKELVLRVRLTREALKEVDAEDTVAALKAMEHNLVHNVLLKGMKGIKKVSMRLVNRDDYDQAEDQFHKVTEWTLDTDGTNLMEILANPNIDAARTRSNDIWEIYNTLGIEAARNALQREFNEVVGDDSLNYRHMSLLLDTMTNRGTLMSVDRHGINRGDVGPLAKCSFEETTDMLIKASIFSEQDRINGVSANIMLGQLPPCGTGDHEVLLDEEAYIRLLLERNASVPPETMQTINENEVQVYDGVCSMDALQMPYNISNKPTKQMPMPKIAFV